MSATKEVRLSKQAEDEIAELLHDRGYARCVNVAMDVDSVARITVQATNEMNAALVDVLVRHHPGATALSGHTVTVVVEQESVKRLVAWSCKTCGRCCHVGADCFCHQVCPDCFENGPPADVSADAVRERLCDSCRRLLELMDTGHLPADVAT